MKIRAEGNCPNRLSIWMKKVLKIGLLFEALKQLSWVEPVHRLFLPSPPRVGVKGWRWIPWWIDTGGRGWCHGTRANACGIYFACVGLVLVVDISSRQSDPLISIGLIIFLLSKASGQLIRCPRLAMSKVMKRRNQLITWERGTTRRTQVSTKRCGLSQQLNRTFPANDIYKHIKGKGIFYPLNFY